MCVWQHNVPKHRSHPGKGALHEKAADRLFKSTMQRELCPEDLVLAEHQKEDADKDAQCSERSCIAMMHDGHTLGTSRVKDRKYIAVDSTETHWSAVSSCARSAASTLAAGPWLTMAPSWMRNPSAPGRVPSRHASATS